MSPAHHVMPGTDIGSRSADRRPGGRTHSWPNELWLGKGDAEGSREELKVDWPRKHARYSLLEKTSTMSPLQGSSQRRSHNQSFADTVLSPTA